MRFGIGILAALLFIVALMHVLGKSVVSTVYSLKLFGPKCQGNWRDPIHCGHKSLSL